MAPLLEGNGNALSRFDVGIFPDFELDVTR